MDSSNNSSLKHELSPTESPRVRESKRQRSTAKVVFAAGDALEKVHYFDQYNEHEIPNDRIVAEENESRGSQQASKLTEELTLLSTLHGKARRELRDISKHDLQTAMKYGIKTPGRTVNGKKRWKFEFGNTVFITDEHCTEEVTCYKKPIQIERANITQAMRENHEEAVRVLRDDPHLVSVLTVMHQQLFHFFNILSWVIPYTVYYSFNNHCGSKWIDAQL
jgi:hypothetical protein